MTLAESAEIFGYWEHSPPAHLMLHTIARLLGWMPREAPQPVPDLQAMAVAPSPGLTVLRGPALGMPPPLDIDALRERNRALAIERASRRTQ